MMTDRFGLNKTRLVLDSKIREVFTPFKPVSDIDLLFDRSEDVGRLVEVFTTPGLHALIFGERGVGKSSLANVAVNMLVGQLFDDQVFTFSCTAGTTFEDIVEDALKSVGVDIRLDEREVSGSTSAKAGLSTPVVAGGIESMSSAKKTFRRHRSISPFEVCSALRRSTGLLVIDEADALRSVQDKTSVAELIKLLSDSDSAFRVLVVGIADTAAELTGAHPSVQRCLREIRLSRMTDTGLREIIVAGAARIGLDYSADVVHGIVYCSDGYPFFTHLLALKAGEIAVGEERTLVTEADLAAAMAVAARDSEGTLRTTYDNAVRSTSTDMYRHVIYGASLLPGSEFTSEQLREAIRKVRGQDITQGSLNNYFQKLVSNDGSTIITRVKKGMYRFTDPRMAAHARIANGGGLSR